MVKTSYFPNWKVSGAEGPYRVSPNLMVVIPTDTHVSMHYGYTSVDLGSYVLTFLGLAGLIWFWRARPITMPEMPGSWQARPIASTTTSTREIPTGGSIPMTRCSVHLRHRDPTANRPAPCRWPSSTRPR